MDALKTMEMPDDMSNCADRCVHVDFEWSAESTSSNVCTLYGC